MRTARPPQLRLLAAALWLGALMIALPAAAAEDDAPALRQVESKYYVIHTDLPEVEAREAALRMTCMADEYRKRTAAFAGQVKGPMPFYLYDRGEDYLRAGGIENSAGAFDGERLMARALRRDDGEISLSTWHIVQHEGFHQFAHAVIGPGTPMWAEEGLAEYFGEALFTGDGFVVGLIPQGRLARVRQMMRDEAGQPLRPFLARPREQWNAKVEMRNYDRAWSFVHFLIHADEATVQPAFSEFMREVGTGADAEKTYDRLLGAIPRLEVRWREWWLALPERPAAEAYGRSALAIFTSFLARAHAQGQAFPTFEAFAKTPPADLLHHQDDWLPPGLFTMAFSESIKMRSRGDAFTLDRAADGTPLIVLTMKSGAQFAGRFALTQKGRPLNVRVEKLRAASPTTTSATRSTTRPAGEMLR